VFVVGWATADRGMEQFEANDLHIMSHTIGGTVFFDDV